MTADTATTGMPVSDTATATATATDTASEAAALVADLTTPTAPTGLDLARSMRSFTRAAATANLERDAILAEAKRSPRLLPPVEKGKQFAVITGNFLVLATGEEFSGHGMTTHTLLVDAAGLVVLWTTSTIRPPALGSSIEITYSRHTPGDLRPPAFAPYGPRYPRVLGVKTP